MNLPNQDNKYISIFKEMVIDDINRLNIKKRQTNNYNFKVKKRNLWRKKDLVIKPAGRWG